MTGAKPLRIAILADVAPNKLGSIEAWFVAIALEARRRGHSVDLITADPVHPEIQTVLANAGIGRAPIDVIRTHPVRSARRFASRYDVLHLNFMDLRDTYAKVAFGAWPARVLVVDHASRDLVDFGARPLRRLIARLSMIRIASIAGVSHYVTTREESRFGVRGSRFRTIYNGVDTARFAPSPSRAPRDGLHLLVVAHLIPQKGVHVLLDAVAQCARTDLTVRIVGNGPERGALESQAKQLGIASRTTFLGIRDDVDALLRDTDIVVHPALWQEAFGLTIAEAMATGCATIATRAGAIPELITDGVEGILVPPGDVDALSRAIVRLGDDPALRSRLGAAARARVQTAFPVERSAAAHVDWCEEMAIR